MLGILKIIIDIPNFTKSFQTKAVKEELDQMKERLLQLEANATKKSEQQEEKIKELNVQLERAEKKVSNVTI